MIRKLLLVFSAVLASQTLHANSATPRIVGGEPADPDWHTLVALVSKPLKAQAIANSNPNPVYQAQFCGGTLLSREWVLTAAHCVTGLFSSNLEIMVGSQTLDIDPDSSLLKDVASIHIHPNYDSETDRNDIALIRLAETANPGLSTVSTAVLARQSTDNELQSESSYNDVLSALGWGVIRYEGENNTPVYPMALQEVALDYLPNPSCQRLYDTYANSETIYGSMLCARETTPDPEDNFGEDSCQGDSGGPLFVTRSTLDDSPQVGVTSFGYQCGNPNIPGVYSRVSRFLDWIEQVTSGQGPLRDLTVKSSNGDYQGVSNIPFDIIVANPGNRAATDFTLTIEHASSLTLAEQQEGLSCTNPSTTLTMCNYTGTPVTGGASLALAFSAADTLARDSGSETMVVTVTLDDYRDYHRLNNSGNITLDFGYPSISLSAAPVCRNVGSDTVQMRVKATLTNVSAQIHSQATTLSGTLPESLTLVGKKTSKKCSMDELRLLTCNVGRVAADGNEEATIALRATPETLESLQVTVDNQNGFTADSILSNTVELDFSREDLPKCPKATKPSSGGSGGGGSMHPGMMLLGAGMLWWLRRRNR